MIFNRNISGLLAVAVLAAGLTGWANVAVSGQSKVMPLAQVKKIMDLTKDSWVAFRNFSGRQLIYFTHIVSWNCGIKAARYSLDSAALDQQFPLPACNEQMPNAIADGVKIHLQFKLASVSKIAVQLVFDDDSKSEVLVYQPCSDTGDTTCAQHIETIAAKSQ